MQELTGYRAVFQDKFESNVGTNFTDVFIGFLETDPRFGRGTEPDLDTLREVLLHRFGENFEAEVTLRLVASSRKLRPFKFIIEDLAHREHRDFFIRLGKALSGKKRKPAAPIFQERNPVNWEICRHWKSSDMLRFPLKAFTDSAAHGALAHLLHGRYDFGDDYKAYTKRRQRLNLRPDRKPKVFHVRVRNGQLELLGKGGQILGQSMSTTKRAPMNTNSVRCPTVGRPRLGSKLKASALAPRS
jgi:hypothetical protein